MKNVFGDFLKTGFRGIIFGSFAAVFFTGIAYALTYNWSDPSALRGKVAGNVVQSSQWNLLVGNVDNLNERLANAESAITTLSSATPAGAVMAFNLTTCPTGWAPADGTGSRPDLRGQFIRGMNTFD
ncbi:MAG: hypothetical protein QG650_217 [Patescibacteria group bacterium]|nr:hypothetical protein [Patescibacteria group bacterium]